MQLQTDPRGRLSGAHQLHCSVLRMQRSEVKWEAREMLDSILGGQSYRDFFSPFAAQVVICGIDFCNVDKIRFKPREHENECSKMYLLVMDFI